MGKVIVTADDYGACQYIDTGIERAIKGGHVNTVSAFVTHKRSAESITALNKKRKESLAAHSHVFHIGLHFSITSGYSLQNKDTSLTHTEENGQFYFFEAKNYPFNGVDSGDLEKEIIAQLNELDRLLGEDPIDHVSVHHGVVYLDSDLYDVFINTIAAYKGPAGKVKYDRPIPIRSPQSWFRSDKVHKCCYNPETGEKMLLSEIITEGFELGFWRKLSETTPKKMREKRSKADALHIRTSDLLVDVIYNQCCAEGMDCLFNQLKEKDLTAEFMLHLGYQDGIDHLPEWKFTEAVQTEHGINKGYFYRRMVEELRTIEEINLAAKLKEFQITPIGFSQL